tara:strand:+ start:779 stop:1225 length:447 start_codon:yes stop_codon:yes gene_type:complete
MAFPTNDITTTQLDAASGSIAGSRVELRTGLLRLSELIDSRDTTNGLAPLDSNGQVPAANMPTTLTSGGSNAIIFQPATGYVLVQNNLALTARTVAQLEADSSPAGTIAYCSNGDGGSACLAVAQGAQDTAGDYQWQRIALGNVISTS